MNPGLFIDLGAQLIGEWRASGAPADHAMQRFFQARRFLGSKDRRRLGDAFFHWLRHRRRFEEAISAAGIGEAITEKAGFAIAAAEIDPPEADALATRLADGDAALADCIRRASQFAAEWRAPLAVEDSAGPEPLDPYAASVRRSAFQADVGLQARSTNSGSRSSPPESVRSNAATNEAREHSFPDFLWERLGDGRSAAERLALAEALNGPAPTTLRVNALRCAVAEAHAALREAGTAFRAPRWAPEAIVLEKRAGAAQLPRGAEGWLEFQDESSQLASIYAAPAPGSLVIDACAGGGGKALHLAALMRDEGEILAFDVSMGRLREVERRALRAGAASIRIIRLDEEDLGESARDEQGRNASEAAPPTQISNLRSQISDSQSKIQNPKSTIPAFQADLVFIDAPCSGTGTLRRSPDIKWRLTEDRLEELRATQAALLDRWSRAVKPGGALVYATCSALREENAAQIEAFLARTKGFARDRSAGERLADRLGPAARELVNIDGDLALSPDRHGCDGFYAARLVRRELPREG